MILTDIESTATSAFISLIAKSDYLVPSINSLDRGPSWDGKILVYDKPGDNHSKDDYKYGIPVQIKGKKLKRTKKKFSYPVEISDLKNYKKEVGVIFVVVCFDDNGENIHIYYKALLSYDLKRLLKDSDNQKTKMIHLRELPSNVNKVTEIFLTIAGDFEKQKADSSFEQIFSYEDLMKDTSSTEFFFNCTVLEPNAAIDYLFENGAYIYVKTKEGIPIPIDHVECFDEYITIRKKAISVNGELFYNEYKVVRRKDSIIVTFGKSSHFGWGFKNNKTEFRLCGTLSERILDCEFYLSLIEGGTIYIDSDELCHTTPNSMSQEDRQKIQRTYEELIEIRDMFIALNVKEDLQMDNMTATDIYCLRNLIEAFRGKEIKLNDTGNPFGCYTIANLKILICAQKNASTGLFKVHNFFEAPFRIYGETYDGKKKIVPLFTALYAKDIATYCNIDEERILGIIESTDYTDIVSNYVTHFLLEVIKAYDINPKKELLIFAEAIILKICNKPCVETDTILMMRLNKIQIIKRQRPLNDDEKFELKNLLKSEITDETKLGILILLDAHIEAELVFERLTKEQQEVFSDYPIFKFYKEERS